MNYKGCSSSSSISLAGLRRISVPLRLRRKTRKKKIPKVKDKLMDFWHKMIFPVRRVWLALSSRLKQARPNGDGLLKLQDDVQTCGYQDVQVMWEMLRRTETEVVDSHQKRKQQPFWGVFVLSSNANHSDASSESSESS
ncbi:uncharacterized protein LOC129288707 [Prosopis cineraria]|uniref:uncharacterized protein LOC129288707 n=1 Tax=Prosopis cineraria TaxID=364024 RepID=UPI00240EC214|nr:uncharacterized protein LOC129288707 [Prosopis cineraria]